MNEHPFIFDSCDEAVDERLKILNDREGVWRCRTILNCTEACPREIRITKAIGEVKEAILKGSSDITVRPPATSRIESLHELISARAGEGLTGSIRSLSPVAA